jgi:hypothetical protein
MFPDRLLERQALSPPSPIPAWARASGRAGQGDPLFAAGAAPALLDGHLRCDPPAAGTLRARLALKSAAASAKTLRLNADAAALRDLRFAVGDTLGPAANLLSLWRDLAGRPPSLEPSRLADAAARLDLALADANSLAQSLSNSSRAGIRSQPLRRPRPASFPPSRTPQRPPPKSSPTGCSTRRSPSGCTGPGPCRSSPRQSWIRVCAPVEARG